jgi:hypothetical protein
MVRGVSRVVTPSITVVVPVYITKPEQVAMTNRCILLANQKTNIPFKLTIVESKSRVMTHQPCDLYIHEREAENSTKSMNRAFACVDTDYTILLTNDVYVSDGWIESLIEPFDMFGDCGVSTLASTQFNHAKNNVIEPDGIWFSVAMWKTCGKAFDEKFKNVWDDTDFTMKQYLAGKRSYRNHSCVVEHLIGQTQYIRTDHQTNFDNGRRLFIEKYKSCGHPMFNKLAGI